MVDEGRVSEMRAWFRAARLPGADGGVVALRGVTLETPRAELACGELISFLQLGRTGEVMLGCVPGGQLDELCEVIPGARGSGGQERGSSCAPGSVRSWHLSGLQPVAVDWMHT